MFSEKKQISERNADPETTDNRNSGIDILKALTMLMIIAFHMLGHGGMLKAAVPFSFNYYVVWSINIVLYSVVDIYVMITGFVYARRKARISSIVLLWITVFFYSFGIPIVMALSGYDIGLKTIIKGCFPLLQSQYWFFTEYFALFFTIPILNLIMKEKKRAVYVVTAGFLLLSVMPVLAQGRDLFITNSGFSYLWFLLLYCCGSYIGLYGIPTWLKTWRCLLLLAICFLFLAVFKLGGEYIEYQLWGDERYSWILLSYSSPFVLLSAAMFVCLFLRIRVTGEKTRRALSMLAKGSFGVYLIHENESFRANLISSRFAFLSSESPILLVFHLFCYSLLIFILCSLIEYIRIKLFGLLSVEKRVRSLTSKISEKIKTKFSCSSETD